MQYLNEENKIKKWSVKKKVKNPNNFKKKLIYDFVAFKFFFIQRTLVLTKENNNNINKLF